MEFTPNPEQKRVIEAAAAARLVVDGGPGTGKTATAAARAIALCAGGIAPERLVLISFTRAAVEEMRRRLTLLAKPGTRLPRVTTLDSFAWSLRDGELEGDKPVVENYDAAIAETFARLRQNDAHIVGRLAVIDHLIIDETQDLVDERALLVIAIAAALPQSTGLTILTDEAQAIYGFASRGFTADFTAETVAQHFLELEPPFALHELTLLHRTGEKKLKRLFAKSRHHALAVTGNPRRKLSRMRRSIVWRAHRAARQEAGLILYRSRAEVLHTGRGWAGLGRPHRLRLSGMLVLPFAWIALLLHDFAYDTLRRETFADLWRERIGRGDAAQAWQALAGDHDLLSLPKLRASLAESEPPPALSCFDPGAEKGPVIGTIHASKGREADHVRLMLPASRTETFGGDDPDSEARVLFVGATRAKKSLAIGKGANLGARRLKNGRVYIPARDAARVEIGRPGDFDWSPAADLLTTLAAAGHGAAISLRYDNQSLSAYLEDHLLGRATPQLMSDLRSLRGVVSTGYGPFIIRCEDAYLLDRGTVVGGDRFYLAPIISGLPLARFYAAAANS